MLILIIIIYIHYFMKEKNVNIDYNHIYSLFYDLLQKNNYRYLDSHI